MKLNLWQWLGVVLLLAGLAFWIWERRQRATTPVPGTTPSVQPVR